MFIDSFTVVMLEWPLRTIYTISDDVKTLLWELLSWVLFESIQFLLHWWNFYKGMSCPHGFLVDYHFIVYLEVEYQHV